MTVRIVLLHHYKPSASFVHDYEFYVTMFFW